jgi:hypothetical protein
MLSAADGRALLSAVRVRGLCEALRFMRQFCLYLAAAFVTVRQLIQRARRHRWDTRPTTKRLK